MHQSELHPKDEAEETKRAFARHIKEDGALETESNVQHKDGRKIPVLIRTKLFKIGDKELIIGIFVDISERKRMERELTAKMEDLQKLNAFMKDREKRILELKREVDAVLTSCGKDKKYKV